MTALVATDSHMGSLHMHNRTESPPFHSNMTLSGHIWRTLLAPSVFYHGSALPQLNMYTYLLTALDLQHCW